MADDGEVFRELPRGVGVAAVGVVVAMLGLIGLSVASAVAEGFRWRTVDGGALQRSPALDQAATRYPQCRLGRHGPARGTSPVGWLRPVRFALVGLGGAALSIGAVSAIRRR